ncbi:Mss4-like protein [Hypoxylon sp. FL1284]|nr:Mss4-like protein [Hypoxylon sp. FL1284]
MDKEGGCFCGKIRISYEGEPANKLLCHCTDCRKITGSTFSTNVMVPSAQFRITSGTPKTITKVADSGKDITSSFCGDCGTTLFRESETFGNNKAVKAGIMDDQAVVDDAKPAFELFAHRRVGWVPEMPGAEQS